VPVFAALAVAGCGGSGALSAPAGPERIAFVSRRADNVDVYVVHADGTRERRLTEHPGRDEAPAWSPDGSRIAFVSNRDHAGDALRDYELYVMAADGSGERRLTDDRLGQGRPQWLRDGRIVVTVCGEDLRTCRLEAVHPDDGRREPFGAATPQAALFGGSVSPDGSLLAYAQPAEGAFWDARSFDVWLDAVAGGQARRLTIDPANDWGPDWSPEGGHIAFVSDRDRLGRCLFHDCVGHAPEIYVMDAHGENERRLTRNPASDGSPTWSPDGTRIAFARIPSESSHYDVHVMNADGGCETRITTGRAWEWQPDWDPSAGAAGTLRCVDLQLSARAGAPFARVGSIVRYRVSLSNVGTLAGERVRVSVALPPGARPVRARASAGTCTPMPLSCEVGRLGRGREVSIVVDVRVGRAGVARPRFTARSGASDPDTTNNWVRFQTIACTRVGSGKADRIVGTPHADVLCGFGGADRLDGRGGDDRLYGGLGNDVLIGGPGRDRIERDPGCDVVRIRDGQRDFAWADAERPPGLESDIGFDRVNIPGDCR